MGERRQYSAPRLPLPEHQDVRWPSPAAARQDRRESVRTRAWSRPLSARGGAGPTGPRFPEVFVDQLVVMEFSKPHGARSRGRALVVMGPLGVAVQIKRRVSVVVAAVVF